MKIVEAVEGVATSLPYKIDLESSMSKVQCFKVALIGDNRDLATERSTRLIEFRVFVRHKFYGRPKALAIGERKCKRTITGTWQFRY